MHYKVDFTEMPWESTMEGMRQKIHKFGSRQLRLVEYSKKLSPHWCERGHIVYVLHGQLGVQFEHEIQHYSPGDGIAIPGGQEHKHMAKLITNSVTVFFIEDV